MLPGAEPPIYGLSVLTYLRVIVTSRELHGKYIVVPTNSAKQDWISRWNSNFSVYMSWFQPLWFFFRNLWVPGVIVTCQKAAKIIAISIVGKYHRFHHFLNFPGWQSLSYWPRDLLI